MVLMVVLYGRKGKWLYIYICIYVFVYCIYLYTNLFSYLKIIQGKLFVYDNAKAKKAKIMYDLKECEINGAYMNEVFSADNNNKVHKVHNNNNNTILSNLRHSTKHSIFSNSSTNPQLIFENPEVIFNKLNQIQNQKVYIEKEIEIEKSPFNPNNTNTTTSCCNNENKSKLTPHFPFNNAVSEKIEKEDFLLEELEKVPDNTNNKLSSTKSNNLIRHPSFENISPLNYKIEIEHPYLEKCVFKGAQLIESYQIYHQILETLIL